MLLDHLETFTPFKEGCVFVFNIYNLEYLVLDFSLYLFVSLVIINVCFWCIYIIMTFAFTLMQYMF
jgi:hypothetical protein